MKNEINKKGKICQFFKDILVLTVMNEIRIKTVLREMQTYKCLNLIP